MLKFFLFYNGYEDKDYDDNEYDSYYYSIIQEKGNKTNKVTPIWGLSGHACLAVAEVFNVHCTLGSF